MQKAISSFIETCVNDLLAKISDRHKIQLDSLVQIYNEVLSEHSIQPAKKKVVKAPQTNVLENTSGGQLSETYLRKCTKDELTRLCKMKELKTTGNKDDLVKRLVGPAKPTVIEKLFKSDQIRIVKNEYGNRMHTQTRLVFSEDKIVVGIQNEDGTVGELTPDLIDVCNQYKFKYKLPTNLDTSVKSEDIDKKLSNIISEEKSV